MEGEARVSDAMGMLYYYLIVCAYRLPSLSYALRCCPTYSQPSLESDDNEEARFLTDSRTGRGSQGVE